tara:strand:- start:1364 stop:1807 length:444 start_codon:yes stop_codon:yes gene_type:complete
MDKLQFGGIILIIGYTTGVFDLFHVGHINILKSSKSLCDKLIVGISTDELVKKNKNKNPVIPFLERIEIVRNISFVDLCVPQEDDNKILAWNKLKYHKLFVGDDWFQNNKWKDYETELKSKNVSITYFPYTKGTSSTKINNILNKFR